MNPLWNPAIRSPDTAKTLNLDAWPESHHRAHDPGKPPGTDKTQTHGRSRAACTAYILSCRSHNLTLLRRAHGTAVTWQDLLLPEGTLESIIRQGPASPCIPSEFPFLSLTRPFGIGGVGSNLDSRSEEMATHPPPYALQRMYSVHHLHFISTSVRTVPRYVRPAAPCGRHDAPRAYCIQFCIPDSVEKRSDRMKKLARSRIACSKGVPCAVCASSDGACVLIRDWTDRLTASSQIMMCVFFPGRGIPSTVPSFTLALSISCVGLGAAGTWQLLG